MRVQIDGDWEGWDGDTLVKLMDGSAWRQADYHYEYTYSFMPLATLKDDMLHVDGMSCPIRVRKID